MAILTLQGHVSRAIDFFNKDSIYMAIGKSTPWDKDTVKDYEESRDYDAFPPAPANTDNLLEVIGYKKVEFRSLVVQDDNGTLEYRGSKWKIVPIADAIQMGARWVYISTTLTYNELPTEFPYRQVGVYTGVQLSAGVDENKYNLLPSEVNNPGLLEVLDNRKPVFRDNDVRETIKLIMEF